MAIDNKKSEGNSGQNELHDPANSAIAKIIEWSIKNQLLVIIGTIALAVAGWISINKTPLDAIPDLTDTQVIVRTDFQGLQPGTHHHNRR